ncbi:MAG: 50S ribosomal protein L11 methyltransferase [Solirubrobacteraceae bacterium]
MLRLALRVRRDDAEIVLAELLELAPNGVEEVDVDAGTVEYALYGDPGELPQPPDLQAVAGGAFIGLSTTALADDWAERWREFHRPLVLGNRLCVRPPWEPPADTELDLVIDPGRAFGTGAHASTRLCLEFLLEMAGPPASGSAVVDVGCGSGVLAIAAAKLGWPSVAALDYDPVCLQATAANAAVNHVELSAVRLFDLRSEPVMPARLVLANLLAPLLNLWAQRMAADDLDHPDQIIASGLLVEEADGVSAAFAGCGYVQTRRREHGGWTALLLQKAGLG